MIEAINRYIADAEHHWAKGEASSALAYIGSAVAELKVAADKIKALEEDAEFLWCLEACGVDNWEGYSDAVRMANGEEVE